LRQIRIGLPRTLVLVVWRIVQVRSE